MEWHEFMDAAEGKGLFLITVCIHNAFLSVLNCLNWVEMHRTASLVCLINSSGQTWKPGQ
jgi:hypothetical protein